MLPSTCVVVPTYWTRQGGARRTGDAVYDHPTPAGTEGTLGKLLDSLDGLEPGSFFLLLLVAVTADDASEEAERSVRSLAGAHSSIPTIVFGPSNLAWLRSWLTGNGLEGALEFLDLRAYPRIRNLQLALPLALRASAIVALDDDEVVTDRTFLQKATGPLGAEIGGRRVDGLSGHYLQDDGSILLKVDPEKAKARNLFDRKAAIMNEATETLEDEPGNVVLTPFCFGGNMEFTPELAASVGFDPGITRGEDIDYLINARMEGKQFFLRKDLRILHCPPSGGSYKDASVSKLEQDVIRFMYERKKLRLSQEDTTFQPVTAEDLMPYPGEFLEGDLTGDACAALRAAGAEDDCEAFIASVLDSLDGRLQAYVQFRSDWPVAMERLGRAAPVRDYLLGQAQGM